MLAEEGSKKKNIVLLSAVICLFFLAVLFISGCGTGTDYNETSVKILKKGRIESDIVESFEANYYNASELKDMLNKAAGEYNEKEGEKDCISIKDIDVGKNVARAVIVYRNSSDYAKFNKVDFFYGTVSEALAKGFDLSMMMLSIDDGGKYGFAELKNTEDTHIVILSEPILVETGSEIKYVSANVEYLDETHARMSSDSAGLACIVLEK